MVFFYVLAALSIWFAIQSLLNGIRYAAYVRRETSRALPEFQPFVSVIAPGRGLEQGLSENLQALLEQDYPRYGFCLFLTAPTIRRFRLSDTDLRRWQERSSPDQQRTAGRRFTIFEWL